MSMLLFTRRRKGGLEFAGVDEVEDEDGGTDGGWV